MKLQSIQALRGLAALLVVMSHLRAIDLHHSGEVPLFSSIWVNGVSGVDLFFVISGFIMVWVAGQASRGVRTAGAFLFARASRIYPLWWVFSGALAIYYLFTTGILYNQEHGTSGATHLIRSFLLQPQVHFPILNVGWTLVHEMYFYLAFTAILLMPQRWMAPAFLIWLGLVVAGSQVIGADDFASNYLELIVHPMTIEFILGACTARVIQKGWRPYPWVILMFGIAAFIASFALFDFTASLRAMGWGRVFAFGLPGVMIMYGLVCLEVDERIRIPRFMVSLGDWSYALYLGHLIVFSVFALVWFPTFGRPGILDNIAFSILAASTAILVAWLSYRFLERPMIRWFGKKRSQIFGATNANIKPGPIEPRVW